MNKNTGLDEIFDALANVHRRSIIYTLNLSPRSVSQLAEQQGLSLPAIYKHLKVLERAGFVIRKKHGRTHFIALSKSSISEAQGWLKQFYSYWGNSEEKLEGYVEGVMRLDKADT